MLGCITWLVPEEDDALTPETGMTLEQARALIDAASEGRGMADALLEKARERLMAELEWKPRQWLAPSGKVVYYSVADVSDIVPQDYEYKWALLVRRWAKKVDIIACGFWQENIFGETEFQSHGVYPLVTTTPEYFKRNPQEYYNQAARVLDMIVRGDYPYMLKAM